METLKEIRRQRGWSQKDLADESGVGQDTISGIESGRHEPRPSTLRKLAEALGVQVADFFREPALPKAEAPRGAGPSLLNRALDAARQDEEKTARAIRRGAASEGMTIMPQYEEDKFRAELRTLGFPDKHFEDFIWPLVVETLRAKQLDQELASLREETARLREQVANVE